MDLQTAFCRKAFEKNFSCGPGRYECRVFLEPDDDNPFAVGNRRQLVWEENFEIAEAPEKKVRREMRSLIKNMGFGHMKHRRLKLRKSTITMRSFLILITSEWATLTENLILPFLHMREYFASAAPTKSGII